MRLAVFRPRSIFASLTIATIAAATSQSCIDDDALRAECVQDDDCAMGERCVYRVCVADEDTGDTDGSEIVDGGDGCGSGERRCDGGCTDTRSDPQNCGRCDNACEADGSGTRALCELSTCRVACEDGDSGDYEGSFEWRCDDVDNDCDGSADEACCDTSAGAVTFEDDESRVLGAIAGERAAFVRVFVDGEGSAEFIVDALGRDGTLIAAEPSSFDCPDDSPGVDLVRYSGGGTPLLRCSGADVDTFVALTPAPRAVASALAAGALEPLAAVEGDHAWFAHRGEVSEDVDSIEVIVSDGSGGREPVEPIEPGGVIGSLSLTSHAGVAYIFGISPFDLGVFGVAVDADGSVVAGPDPLAAIDVDTDLFPPLTAAYATGDQVWLAWSYPADGMTTVQVERIGREGSSLTAERSAGFEVEGELLRLMFVANTGNRPVLLVDDLVTIELVDGATGASLASISRTSMPSGIESDEVIDALLVGEMLVIAGTDTRAETVYQPVALDGTLLCPADQ